MDLAANKGTPIYAVANGTVTYAGYDGDYGNSVIIDYIQNITDNGFFFDLNSHGNDLLLQLLRYYNLPALKKQGGKCKKPGNPVCKKI